MVRSIDWPVNGKISARRRDARVRSYSLRRSGAPLDQAFGAHLATDAHVHGRAGMSPNEPILMRAYKKESELEVWKRRADGKYAHLKTYPICRWSGKLWPKVREGDRQAPEGFYTVTSEQMVRNSAHHLSLRNRLSDRLRPGTWPHGVSSHGAWQLLIGRVLRNDRRGDRRDLRTLWRARPSPAGSARSSSKLIRSE